MKNLLLSICLIALTVLTLRAQSTDEIISNKKEKKTAIPMSKGNHFLGLNGAGGFGGGVFGRHNIWTATGQGGYFIANKLLVGAQLSYGEHNRHPGEATGTLLGNPILSYRIVNVNPELFARYYFTSGKVKPFVQASTGWNFTSGRQSEMSGLTTRINENSFTARAALGISFKLGKRANIDLMYTRSLLGKPRLGDYNGFRLGTTFLIGK